MGRVRIAAGVVCACVTFFVSYSILVAQERVGVQHDNEACKKWAAGEEERKKKGDKSTLRCTVIHPNCPQVNMPDNGICTLGGKCFSYTVCGQSVQGKPGSPGTTVGGTGSSPGTGGTGAPLQPAQPKYTPEPVVGRDFTLEADAGLKSGLTGAFNNPGGDSGELGEWNGSGSGSGSGSLSSLFGLFSGLFGLFGGGGSGSGASPNYGWQQPSYGREPQPIYVNNGQTTTVRPTTPTYKRPEYAPMVVVDTTFGNPWWANPVPSDSVAAEILADVSPLEGVAVTGEKQPFEPYTPITRPIYSGDSYAQAVQQPTAPEYAALERAAGGMKADPRGSDVATLQGTVQPDARSSVPRRVPPIRESPGRAVSAVVNNAVSAVFDALPWPASDVLPLLSNILPPPAISVANAANGENAVGNVLGLYALLMPDYSQAVLPTDTARAATQTQKASGLERLANGFARIVNWFKSWLMIE